MIDAEWMTPPEEEEEELDLSFPPESLTCFTGSDNLKKVNHELVLSQFRFQNNSNSDSLTVFGLFFWNRFRNHWPKES